jgi:hypothetical protein
MTSENIGWEPERDYSEPKPKNEVVKITDHTTLHAAQGGAGMVCLFISVYPVNGLIQTSDEWKRSALRVILDELDVAIPVIRRLADMEPTEAELHAEVEASPKV